MIPRALNRVGARVEIRPKYTWLLSQYATIAEHPSEFGAIVLAQCSSGPLKLFFRWYELKPHTS